MIRLNTVYFFILAFILSCGNSDVVSTDSSFEETVELEILSFSEQEYLCGLNLDIGDIQIRENYLICNSDIILDRSDLNKLINLDKNSAVGPDNVPFIGTTNSVSIYIHDSFYNLGDEWNMALDSAISCINTIPHCRVNINSTGTLKDHDIFLFVGGATNLPNEVPNCMCSPANAAGVAIYPLNEIIGKYVAICPNYLSIDPKSKVLAHEITHTLGITHNCSPTSEDGSGCGGANFFGTQIEETYLSPPGTDLCDSTSLMFVVTNGITGNPDYPAATTYNTEPDGYLCPWLNGDDVFSYQALYPISYKSFNFDISSCEIGPIFNTVPQSLPTLRYNLSYIENDFVPYEIKFQLIDLNNPLSILSEKVSYRYWPNFIDFDTYPNNFDIHNDCLTLVAIISNYKGDHSVRVMSNSCCVIPFG